MLLNEEDKEKVRRYHARINSSSFPLSRAELEDFARLDPVGLEYAQKNKNRPMTGAERKAAFDAKKREIGPIPPPEDIERRERYRYDLKGFGEEYCMDDGTLDHSPSEDIINELILPLQNNILNGTSQVCVCGRGLGKTTWEKIAAKWAVSYGHGKIILTISSTGVIASDFFVSLLAFLNSGEKFKKDFPAICIPIADLNGDNKRCRGQRFNGRVTGIYWKGNKFVFPTLRDEFGKLVEPDSADTAIFYGSMKSAVKGINYKGRRPNIILMDDPQTRAMAEAPTEVKRAEAFINGDVKGLRSHTSKCGLIISITPIVDDDLACRLMDRTRHPEFHLSFIRAVKVFPEDWEALYSEFAYHRAEDVKEGDGWPRSTAWYKENQHRFKGMVVADPQNFNKLEVDAVHHILNLRAEYNDDAAFMAECQMEVRADDTHEVPLRKSEVTNAINGCDPFALPPGTLNVVAFCDVNVSADAALRYGLIAFGDRGAKAAVIARGRYPQSGRVWPEDATDQQRRIALSEAIKAVTKLVVNAPCHIFGQQTRVRPSALCFDGGYEMDTVADTISLIGRTWKLRGMDILWSRGLSWNQYRETKNVDASGDHIQARHFYGKDKLTIRKYLAIHADYWREIAQKAWRGGGLTIWGTDPSQHEIFAAEICYERLKKKYEVPLKKSIDGTAWEWNNTRPGHNHWGDVVYGCFAVAAYKGFYVAGLEDKKAEKKRLNLKRVTPVGEKFDPLSEEEQEKKVLPQPRKVVKRKAPSSGMFRKIKRPRIVR